MWPNDKILTFCSDRKMTRKGTMFSITTASTLWSTRRPRARAASSRIWGTTSVSRGRSKATPPAEAKGERRGEERRGIKTGNSSWIEHFKYFHIASDLHFEGFLDSGLTDQQRHYQTSFLTVQTLQKLKSIKQTVKRLDFPVAQVFWLFCYLSKCGKCGKFRQVFADGYD